RQGDCRTLAGGRANRVLAAEHARAFRHARQPETQVQRPGGRLGAEAFAVVADRDGYTLLITFDDDCRYACGGVLDDVVEALLYDAVKVDLRRRVEQPVNVLYLGREFDSGSRSDFADHRLNGFGQAEPVDLIRVQVGGDLAHFVKRLRNACGNFIQLLDGAVLV